MKANELMVGNIVRYDGMTVYIGQVNKTKIEGLIDKNDLLIDIRFRVELLEPISITEELLLKNGFTKKECYCQRHYWREIDGYYIEAQFGACAVGRKCYVTIQEPYGDMVASVDLNHLHQLQNLCNIAGVEMEWKV